MAPHAAPISPQAHASEHVPLLMTDFCFRQERTDMLSPMRITAVLLVALGLCACGGDDDGMSGTGGAGSGATGGDAGGGSGGDGGTSGTGGAGTGGTGGSSGMGGTGGTGGAGSGGTGGSDPTCEGVDCGAHASCTENGNGPECVCDSGFAVLGDDTVCSDVDECADETDTCPDNAACANTEGSFRCDCDLVGTYAGVLYTEVSWAGAGAGLILDRFSSDPAVLPSFELRTITAQDNGELTMTVSACGGETADFCIDPQYISNDPFMSSFPSAAYGQDFPKSLWGKLTPATGVKVQMPLVSIGEPFETDDQAAFLGLSLSGDPLQAWPTSRNDPAITWLDPDEDSVPGVTSKARHADRNGDPEYNDVGESAQCAAAFPPSQIRCDDESTPNIVETCPYPIELLNGATVTWPYDYWISGTNGVKIKAFHTGARTVSRFDGAITSCDTIEGGLVVTQINARLHSCVTDADEACAESTVNTLDGASDPNAIEGGCFKFMRIADGSTCDDVRAQMFDLLADGRCPAPAN